MWVGFPLVTVVTRATLPLPVAAENLVELIGVKLKGKCGFIREFPYDVLLGVDFLRRTPFLLDFHVVC